MARGRKRGVPNKMTMAAREIISEAVHRMGGVDQLVKWAKKDPLNERVFWGSIFPKLLPVQVTGANGGAIEHKWSMEIVFVKPAPMIEHEVVE